MSDQSDYVAPTGVTAAPATSTILDDVLDLFTEQVEAKNATYRIAKGTGRITIKQNLTFSSTEFERYRRAGMDDEGRIDNVRFGATMIAETNMGIFVDGKAVTVDGTPMRMTDPSFNKSVNAPSIIQAVRALFGGDGGDSDILRIANDIVVRSGYGQVYVGERAEPVNVVDPTLPSSSKTGE